MLSFLLSRWLGFILDFVMVTQDNLVSNVTVEHLNSSDHTLACVDISTQATVTKYSKGAQL